MIGGGLSVTSGQAATVSSEAVSFLRRVPQIPFPKILSTFLTSPHRIPSLRAQFSKNQSAVEESLIRRYDLRITSKIIAGIHVLVITPASIKPEHESKILLNIHGGAFVLGSAHDRTGLLMAIEMRIRIYSVEYTLSPEARYPVARDECLAVYRQLVADFGANNIFGMSSSSGCQLMMSMLLRARSEGLPMFARQYLCTPAVDLTGAGDSMVSNASRDIMPVGMLVGMVKQNYLPNGEDVLDERDELYSPIFAIYDEKFPATIISTGTRDVLLSTSVRLYWKLREAGVKVELLVGEGMWHGFNWEEAMPEAVQMRAAVRGFLESS